jgi:hypothetical protein
VVSKPPLEPNLCVGEKRLILEIANYSSGLNLQPALILGRLKILKPLPVSFPPEPEKRAIHKAGAVDFYCVVKRMVAGHPDSNCGAQLWQKERKCKGC